MNAPEELASKRILVMDDQAALRAVVKGYFLELGFDRVDAVMNGLEGMRYLSHHPVDLIICDWHMPKLSGLECLQRVRGHPDLQTLPFLMMTSVSEAAQVKEAIEIGVSDYLSKPFQPAQLGMKAIKLLSASKHKACLAPPSLARLRPEAQTPTSTDGEDISNQVETGDKDENNSDEKSTD